MTLPTISPETKAKLKSILKGAAIAGAAALLVSLSEALTQADFGSWTPWLQALAGVLLNIVKVIKNL